MNAPIFLTEKEIKSQIDYSRQNQSIFFQDKQLYLRSIYPKSNSTQVAELCQKYAQLNLACLLIENDNSITVWLEKETKTIQEKIIEPNKPIIACIDDSKTIQFAVKTVLESAGYEVLNIIKATEQLKLLLARKPVLILMDINMPDISGYKLCEKLKNSPVTRHIPIVMLTGCSGTLDRVRAKLNGAEKYMTKPFQPEKLINTVTQLI